MQDKNLLPNGGLQREVIPAATPESGPDHCKVIAEETRWAMTNCRMSKTAIPGDDDDFAKK